MSKIYLLASTVAFAVVLGGWPSSASATTYTGCLTKKGRIVNLEEGDSPRRECDDDERLFSLNSSDPEGVEGPVGPKGDKGDTGDTGPQGDKGESGDTGPQGLAGSQGPKGDTGPQGAAGADGADGATGAAGTDGADGAAGPQGDKGETGDAGPQGLAGPKGDKGDMADPAQIQALKDQIDGLTERVEALEPPESAGTSCRDILAANPSATNGVYAIDLEGDGGSAPFDVYCDMVTDGGGWTVIFESSDPSIWGHTRGTPGTGEWSQDFLDLNFPMSEILFTDVAGSRFETVTGISSAELYACTEGTNGNIWNGGLVFADGAFHIGVHTNERKNQPNGYVIVSREDGGECRHDRRGWGFGHRAFQNDQQGWGWDSVDLGRTVFSIAIR